MKKRFLTAMLFFAFLAIGAQNANAQYLNVDDATNTLMTEMEAIVANPIYANGQEKNAQYPMLKNKLEVYNHVFELIKSGETVSNAIDEGIAIPASDAPANPNLIHGVSTSVKSSAYSLLQQDLVDLLTQ